MTSTGASGCEVGDNDNDSKQAQQTEQIQQQSSSKLGLPNIVNFQEKQALKTIMEECDKANLVTYAYHFNAMKGMYTYVGQCIGYPVPYGTEYTNPQRIADHYNGGYAILPQADPNGLYKAENVEATWVMLIDPKTKKSFPYYSEEKLNVFEQKLEKRLCDPSTLPADY